MAGLSLDTVVTRRPDPLTAPIDGELAMLDVASSSYYGLDAIGSRIWELIEQPVSVADLCGTLEGEFDVEPETCRTDVLAFLDQLREAGLVDVR